MAALLVLAVPFFPDEKLIRLKLQALEWGLFALVTLTGLRILWEPGAWRIFPSLRNNKTRIWLYGAVAVWFVAQFILWMLSVEKSLANAEMRRVTLAFASFAAFAFFPLKENWRKIFLGSWAVSAGLIGLYGLLQLKGGVGNIMVPQMERPMSTYGNPIFFAAFLLVSIYVSLAAWLAVKNKSMRFVLALAILIEILALYFSQTRGAWIGFGATLLLLLGFKMGLRKIPWWAWLLVLVGGGLFVVATQNIWMRDQSHLLIWRDTLKMWRDHPLAGVGLGAFHTNFVQYASEALKAKWPQGEFIVNYAHNEYIQMLAEGGLLGFLPFLAIILSLIYWKMRGEGNNFLFLGIVAILIQNLFSVDMRFSISLAMMFILMGVCVAPAEPLPAEGRIPAIVSVVGSAIWLFVLGGVVLPQMVRPYQAQKVVSAQKDFFDERLLDPAKTVADLEKLAAQYPHEPAVMERLAFAYAKEIKSPQGAINREMARKAVAAYDQVIALDSHRLGAYNNIANIYYTVGDVNQALAYWDKAVAVNPQFLEGHLNLGKVLYVQGRLKESAAHFEKALQIDPKNSEAIVYLRKMVE